MTFSSNSDADADADTQAHPPATPAPVVATAAGQVRGFWRGESAAFLGIPFAEAPVGELRFAAPVPKAPWEGVFDATAMGATPQRGGDGGVSLIPEPSVKGKSTLNVNVFTPAPDAHAALPVLVYIHGGGFFSGSAASPWYDGAAFNRDGVVTVTISYRLGFQGFGHIEGAPSNRGVRDWLLALEWVQKNIAAFGGDPSRVTIAGQSAGGGAVLALLGMPAAQHLFAAAWCMSGATADVPPHRAREIGMRLAELAGVTPDVEGFGSLTDGRINHLREDASRPANGSPLAGIKALFGQGLSVGPMIDGDLMTRTTVEALAAGIGADKPLVLGATDDEFTMVTDSMKSRLRFVPSWILLLVLGLKGARRRAYVAANRNVKRKGTAALVGRYGTDRLFRSLVARVAAVRGAAGREEAVRAPASTWVYQFSWVSPAKGWACHCLDVPFFFDCLHAERVPALAGENPPAALAGAVHGAAASFVRTGDPGWPAWSNDPGTTRIFGGPASAPDVIRNGYTEVTALL